MKALLKLLVFLGVFVSLFSCSKPEDPSMYHGVPIMDIELETHKHLDTWFPTIIDSVNGGYWTNFEYDWKRSKDQRKMIVTQARGLWTASKASRMFPGNPVYRNAADHGYRFITQKMWDGPNGGGFSLYHPVPRGQQYKLLYGNAFALFALSEYAKINPAPEVYSWIYKTLDWMDEVARDTVNKGYFNIILSPAVFSLSDSAYQSLVVEIGWGDPTWKDQNTSIHILEALTTLYQVAPDDEEIRSRLEEMLHLVRDKMVSESGSLYLNFTADWQAITHRDSSREYIEKNLQFDHISFGHNIETAYLLVDAAQALYGAPDSKTMDVAKKLVDHTLKYGFDKNYYGLFDRGYDFEGKGKVDILNRQKTWWAQAEACHTLALFADYFPKEKKYPYAFEKMWGYLQEQIMDKEFGGWYNNGLDTNPENKTDRKAHQWKGPYHDGRTLMQLLSYARKNQENL